MNDGLKDLIKMLESLNADLVKLWNWIWSKL